MRMLSTRANRNGVAVTEAFIGKIVGDADKYVCIPLCADTQKLKDGDHKRMGHMLDQRTGTFLSEQIGAFSTFTKVEDEFGVSLIGEARIAKRNEKVCAAILELFDAGDLNFSFEILASEISEKDGVTVIDAGEHNELIGMAVVSFPAYPEAKALALVADAEGDNRECAMLMHTAMEMAETDFETIRCWFFDALHASLGEALWDYRIERLGADFAVLYGITTAQTLKVEFATGDGGLLITDVYEVVYQRKESTPPTNQEGDVTQMSETNQNMDVQLQAAQKEIETLKGEIATKDARIAEQDAAMEQVKQEAEQQETELATLRTEAETLRAEKTEAEQEAKRQEMRRFAETHGLDVESEAVANAIANVDYAALMAESTAAAKEPLKAQMASYTLSASGIQTEAYGGLLARA